MSSCGSVSYHVDLYFTADISMPSCGSVSYLVDLYFTADISMSSCGSVSYLVDLYFTADISMSSGGDESMMQSGSSPPYPQDNYHMLQKVSLSYHIAVIACPTLNFVKVLPCTCIHLVSIKKNHII